ncbi:isoprenylcysteine carboxylmethyltransferase family protein [Flavobacterium sp.]|uniref:methyltransferase family protein n=1 Tax=Flavobacterium sp. TaxID=239 RepID=UPI000ED6143F|nr:isoprenylcysteine carboxylmethyltransferase family protein [Flavobacterium sp.]HCQ12190.1 isoprenylcysteine carboxylmethyltransferase family protein [Flavobacterium sp.]
MSENIKIGLTLIWISLLLFWIISGRNNKQSIYKESFFKRFLFYWLPLLVAILLLGPGEWFGHTLIRENFVEQTNLVGVIGLSVSFVGLLIACWSRYLLGKNWSLSVQKKENHELINSGPYSILRHPIYTGILLIFIGNTIIVGDYRGIIAVVIVFISFWFKLKKEEKWLIEIFGEDYHNYKKTTKAILPYLL